jgi:hypothetical protein
VAEALGDRAVDGLADDLGAAVAKQMLELAVDHLDEACGVDPEESGRCGVDDVAQESFGTLRRVR